MTNEELIKYLNENFPGVNVTQGNQFAEMTIGKDDLVNVAIKLKESQETRFDFLISLTGVDYSDCMGIIYHLESTKYRHIMVLKVKTSNREEPLIDTLTDVWRTAKYHEREVYDLLGVKFNKHSDLRRLFLEDGWGFPLRKDYKDEVRIIER
ncbi:MAG: NADH-quinone oxidoreductase subunit C [Prolixibacteraceae bacterium]|nr:NADH-quinone oxidoreductase subunit C [Prolixibacteraceae bacterium]